MALNLTAARTILNQPDPNATLRRKVLTGYEQAADVPVYDPAQALGRSFRSGLEQQAAQGAMGLAYDAEQVKQLQLGEIERQAQQGREQLGRVFALDPGGLRSGGGQRQFETYEGSVLGTKAQALTDIFNRAGSEQRANIGVQQGLLAQTGAEDRAGQAQRLQGLQAGQAFLGQEDQVGLARNEQALAAQQQEFGQGITGRQQTLQEREQQQASVARMAGLTGQIGGQAFSMEGLLGPAAWQDIVARSSSGALTPNERAQLESQARAAYTAQTGEQMTPAQMQELWYGRTVATPVRQTQQAQQQAFAQNIAGRQMTLEETNAALQRAIEQGNATGTFTDPVTGKTYTTLQAEIQRGQLTEQTAARKDQTALAAGGLTGTYGNQQTLAAKRQTEDIAAQQAATRLAERQLTQQNQQFLTQVTGKVAGGQPITAADFGIDVAGAFDAAGNITSQGNDAWARLSDALSVAGVTLTPDQARAIMRGQPVAAATGTTLEGRAQSADVALRQRQLTLQQEQQASQQRLAEADLTGTLGGQETVASREQREASGVRQQLATLEQQRTTLQGQLERARLTGDLNGTQTLEAQLQTLNAEIQRGQLSLAQEQETARQQETRAGLTGYLPVTAQDLGIDLQKYANPNGSMGQAAITAVQQAFRARFNRNGTSEEISALVNGQGVNVGEQTLAGRQTAVAEAGQTVQAEVQRGQLALAERQELSRQREAEAAVTGQWQMDLSPIQLGFDPALLKNPDGSMNFNAYWEFVDRWPEIEANFEEIMGRPMSMEENAALLRGQTIKGAYKPTLDQQRLKMEEAIQRAEQFGMGTDPETGQDIQTLEAKLQQFNIDRARTQDTFDQQMALAQQVGFVTLGANGQVSAADLGIDPQYTAALSPAERLNSAEAQRLKSTYRAMTGQNLSDTQVVELLGGRPMSVSQPIKVETVAARAQREQTSLQWSELSGKIGAAKTEAARQFDASLADRTDLTEAQVAQINAGIRQADTELEQRLIEFAATKQIQWAELLGEGYGSGRVTADTLGVQLPGPINTLTMDQRQQVTQTLNQAFTAMTGRPPSNTELQTLLNQGGVTVENNPTLAARTLATQVSTQALERQADLHKFSQQFGLDERKFTEMQEEADRQFNQTATQISQQYGLDQQKFLLAKMESQAGLTGKIGINGTLSAADLGISVKTSQWWSLPPDEQARLRDDVTQSFTALQGRAPTTQERDALMAGGNVSVQALSTFEARAFAANQAEIARRYGLDEQQFAEASDQFDKQFTMNERNSWLQLNGYATLDSQGNLQFPQGTSWTTDYRKYNDAKTAFNETETKRDLLWSRYMANNSMQVTEAGNQLVARGALPDQWWTKSDAQIISDAADRGVTLSSGEISLLKQGRPITVRVPNLSGDDVKLLADFINGHSAAVAQNSQGNGWASLAGAVVGGTVGFVASGGNPMITAAGVQAGSNAGSMV